jgi:hypothetical protein
MEAGGTVKHRGQIGAQVRVVFHQGDLDRFVHFAFIHTFNFAIHHTTFGLAASPVFRV